MQISQAERCSPYAGRVLIAQTPVALKSRYQLESFTFGMTLDNWLHFGHVLAAMTWVGGGLILSVIGLRARSSSRPAAVREFAVVLPYVGIRVLMPAVILVLVTGVWMVIVSAEWHFSRFCVLFALGLFAVAFLIGAVYLSRVGIQMERLANTQTDDASMGTRLLNRWLAGYGIVLAVLLVAVWDMVFKPGT